MQACCCSSGRAQSRGENILDACIQQRMPLIPVAREKRQGTLHDKNDHATMSDFLLDFSDISRGTPDNSQVGAEASFDSYTEGGEIRQIGAHPPPPSTPAGNSHASSHLHSFLSVMAG